MLENEPSDNPRHGVYEAVILVRIDNMESLTTVTQTTVRFRLVDDGHPIPAADLVRMALKQAPPVPEWSR